MNFKIEKKYYDERIIYKKTSFEIEPGVTVLVGCNGTGKTTLMNHMKNQIEQEKNYRSGNNIARAFMNVMKEENKDNDDNKEYIGYTSYDNLNDGGSNAKSRAGYMGDMTLLAQLFSSSEGESIHLNFSTIVSSLNNKIHSENFSKYFIFLDGVDSGLSIDNILEIKDFFKFFLNIEKNIEIYIIISTNQYEFTIGEKCLDVTNLKYVEFKDYEDYKKFIINSRKLKDKSLEVYNKMEDKNNG